jgi:hypothetical protein
MGVFQNSVLKRIFGFMTKGSDKRLEKTAS